MQIGGPYSALSSRRAAQAVVTALSGRTEVRLTAASGREILLYAVQPGQSCIQSTLGLPGDQADTGAAMKMTEAEVVLIPKPLFLRLMDSDAGFRNFVLRAFGARMADLARMLEQVALGWIKMRLATLLLDLALGNRVTATQADLAARIGTAREVVTRQLHSFATAGLTENAHGQVITHDTTALRQISLQIP